MNKHRWLYGIRKKLIIFTVLTAILPLGILGVTLVGFINKIVTELNIQNFSYRNSTMTGNYKVMVKGFEELTRGYIANNYIQKSLENTKLLFQEETYIKRSLWYPDNRYMEYGIYIDNKGNQYYDNTLTPNQKPEDILSEEIQNALHGSYAGMQILYSSVRVNGWKDRGIFLARNIRHTDLSVEPGILIIKLNQEFYTDLFRDIPIDSNISYGIVTNEGKLCYQEGNFAFTKEILQSAINHMPDSGPAVVHFNIQRHICFVSRDENQSFVFVTMIPQDIVNAPAKAFLNVLLLAMLTTILVSIMISVMVTRPFRKAILGISGCMSSFDESSLDQEIEVWTNSELDRMAAAYNKMLKKISYLMEQVKAEQEEIRVNEYNSLVYQINPHFLYNTLDNIYMLARMDGDETMATLIQSLAQMLRISVSKGENDVTLQDELNHVRCYLNIEQIRNSFLFTYEIHAEEALEQIKIPKIILQPVVENCIKYGFQNMEEGGKIIVRAVKRTRWLVLSVYNNGDPIEPETLKRLNQMQHQRMEEIKQAFPQKKGGYGISNVAGRLSLRYGGDFRLCYESDAQTGTTCTIQLPVGSQGNSARQVLR